MDKWDEDISDEPSDLERMIHRIKMIIHPVINNLKAEDHAISRIAQRLPKGCKNIQVEGTSIDDMIEAQANACDKFTPVINDGVNKLKKMADKIMTMPKSEERDKYIDQIIDAQELINSALPQLTKFCLVNKSQINL